MDAVKFLEEYKRMCDSFENCANCQLLNEDCDNFKNQEFVKKAVQVVEEWSATHPRRTRQSVFLSHYPNAEVDEDGVLKVCPKIVEGSNYMDSHKCGLVPCAVCHKAYWSVGVKEGNADNG